MLAPFLSDPDVTLEHGDCLDVLARYSPGYVDALVTSPPYMDARPEYGSPDDWFAYFSAFRRVCRGPALVNVGRLFRDGQESLWWLRLLDAAKEAGWKHADTLVWVKPNANPIHGNILANRHEYVLLLGDGFHLDDARVPYADSSIPRLKRGWTNHTGVKNDTGRKNGRRQSEPHPLGGRPISYVTVYTGREKGNPHPAPMALGLAEHLVKLAAPAGGLILDPFAGSGTTAIACRRLARRALLVESDRTYCELAAKRLGQQSLLAVEAS